MNTDKYLINKLKSLIEDKYDINTFEEINKHIIDISKYKPELIISGETNIQHSIKVAISAVEFQLDTNSIIACLYHNLYNANKVSFNNLKDISSSDVAELVDKINQLSRLSKKIKGEEKIDYAIKLILVTNDDLRVLMIRLLDKLEDLKTIKFLDTEKQKKLILRIKRLYSPLSDLLGMNKIKKQFDDLLFKYEENDNYQKLKTNLYKFFKSYKISEIITNIDNALNKNGIKDFKLLYRKKGIYSTYKKLEYYHKKSIIKKEPLICIENLNMIHDKFGITILVNTVEDCYKSLSIVHSLYQYYKNDFDDYIALPKSNGYRALQTGVYVDDTLKNIMEIQIRTFEMHRHNEYGAASHILYKIKRFTNEEINIDQNTLENIQSWRKSMSDGTALKNKHLNINLYHDFIFVFSKDQDIFMLPKNSTALDFAYKVHSDVGNYCMGVKVNGKLEKLNYVLNNTDILEVIKSNKKSVKLEWLKIVKTPNAKKLIRKALNK